MDHHSPTTRSRFTTLTRGVLLCGLAALVLPSPDLHAQNAANASRGGSPVDANVGDRDPLATSLRRIEPGNAQHSFANRLTVIDFSRRWLPFDPATPTTTDPATGLVHSQGYQYRAPGVRALVDRPDYLVDLGGRALGRNVQPVRDGAQFMIIPANTVFQLTSERPATPAPNLPAPHENYRDLRLNLQLDRVPAAGSASAIPFPQSALGADQPVPTLDLSQMRFPQLAAQATPPEPVPVDRSQDQSDEQPTADSESATSEPPSTPDAE